MRACLKYASVDAERDRVVGDECANVTAFQLFKESEREAAPVCESEHACCVRE